MVSRIWFCGSASSIRLMNDLLEERAPQEEERGGERASETYGSRPVFVKMNQVAYMPSMSRSPWAKLMTRITPKMIVRPMPMSA